MMLRGHKEPLYAILHRILEGRDTEKDDLMWLIDDQAETIKMLREKLQERQMTLDHDQ
jgi:hypothetical protein